MKKESRQTSSSSTEAAAGSDPVLIGTVAKPHGVKGNVLVHPETDHTARFAKGSVFTAEDGSKLSVAESNADGTMIRVSFRGVTDRSAAEELRGRSLYIDRADRRPLATDEYWPDDLVGFVVLDGSGQEVGSVIDVVLGSGQDRIVVRSNGSEFEVPFVKEIVLDVSESARTLKVADIDGLISPPADV